MKGLFFSFDVVSWCNLLSWTILLYVLLIMMKPYWNIFSYLSKTKTLFKSKILSSLPSSTLSTKGKFLIIIMLFIFIFINNYLSLFSYIFCSSAHILFTFSLSFSIWFAINTLWLLENFKSYLSHLVPTGTPMMLMNFMVFIESISNLIRPVTLGVRLAANIMAGHLLLSLLAWGSDFILLSFLMQIILFFLEIAVSFIQAYVFSLLSYLYFNDIVYE